MTLLKFDHMYIIKFCARNDEPKMFMMNILDINKWMLVRLILSVSAEGLGLICRRNVGISKIVPRSEWERFLQGDGRKIGC